MVRGVVVAALLAVSGCTSLPQTTAEQYAVTDEQLEFTCDALHDLGFADVDCSLTPRPTVVISSVVEDMAQGWEILYGFHYPGEDYIFLNPNYDKEWDTTIVHEMTHYLLTQTYGLVGMNDRAVDKCESERIARVVHHKREGTDYDDSWRKGYGCT